jgi:protein sex-lethal
LEEMFGAYGTIVQKNILRDKISGMPRGVAFVRYFILENFEAVSLI